MKISTKLKLGTLVTVGLILICTVAIFFQAWFLQQLQYKQQLTDKLVETSLQSALLQTEYIAHPGERPRLQWMHVSEKQLRTFDEARLFFTETKERALLEEARTASGNSRELFSKLIDQVRATGDESVVQELANQLSIKVQICVTDTLGLAESSRQKATTAGQLLAVFVGILATLVILISIGLYLLGESIVCALEELGLCTRVIGEGNLDYRIAIKNRDEIGLLADGFNTMTTKLSELHRRLEQKIQQRTQELATAQAKSEAMLLSIGDALVATDSEGRIVLVNQVFEKILGWSESEVQGKKLVDVVEMSNEKGVPIPEHARLVTEVIDKRTTVAAAIFQYKRKDGSSFPVSITVSPITLHGKIIGAVEVFRDITEEKKIDKAKSEFISLASHQLRTPTTSIRWYAEMLLDEKGVSTLTEIQKKYLNEIYRNDRRMIELVDSLLNASSIELGALTIEPSLTYISKIIDGIFHDLNLQINEKQLRVQREFPSDEVAIKSDPHLLRIVFQNLITNALEYSSSGGLVICSIKIMKSEIKVIISDEGCGIPSSDRKRIFTKFFRADNARAIKPGGNGLGLYITKSIIDVLGGIISFNSNGSRGTEFIVSIPN